MSTNSTSLTSGSMAAVRASPPRAWHPRAPPPPAQRRSPRVSRSRPPREARRRPPAWPPRAPPPVMRALASCAARPLRALRGPPLAWLAPSARGEARRRPPRGPREPPPPAWRGLLRVRSAPPRRSAAPRSRVRGWLR